MPVLLCLIHLLLIELTGYALLCVVLGAQRRHWLQILSLSFAMGTGAISLFLFAASLCGLVPNRALLMIIGGITLALLIAITLRRRQISATWPSRPERFDLRIVL